MTHSCPSYPCPICWAGAPAPQTKKERIRALEKRVEELEQKVAQLQYRPVWTPWWGYPYSPYYYGHLTTIPCGTNTNILTTGSACVADQTTTGTFAWSGGTTGVKCD